MNINYRFLYKALYVNIIVLFAYDIPLVVKPDQTIDIAQLASYQELLENNVKREELDAMAFEYCIRNLNTHIAIVWPQGIRFTDTIREGLQEIGTIIYEKQFVLRKKGPFLFMNHIRDKIENAKKLLSKYFPPTFGKHYPIRVFLIETQRPLAEIKEIKDRVRSGIGLDHVGLHINDTHAETIETARIVYVKNSIDFLNTVKLSDLQRVDTFIDLCNQWVSSQAINRENICLYGDIVQAFYGEKMSGKLLCMTHDEIKIDDQIDDILIDNNELPMGIAHPDEIIFNPKNYFYYKDLKCMDAKVLVSKNQE